MKRPVRTGPPPAGPGPRLDLPPFASRTMGNGLCVDVARAPTTPDIAIRLVIDAGAGTTAHGQAGLVALACDLLSEGAGGRSAPEMARWIDGLGASFSARASYDAVVLSMHAMSDQLDAALEYLAEVARRPDFVPEEVARRRELRLDRLRRRNDEPAEVAADALDEAVFGTHPYGAPLAGTVEAVESLDSADLAGFWSSRVGPRAARLVICGDVPGEAAFDAAEAALGDWEAEDGQPVPALTDPPAVASAAGEVLVVDRPESRQTELRIGGIGIARLDDDEVAVLVMNAILGGLFNSRINLNLREDKGWTYGARTALVRRRRPGPFLLWTAVATDVTSRAFAEILGEFERMRTAPPSSEELELAVNSLTLSMPLQFQTTSQLAGHRAEAAVYGLPVDYWERFPDRVRAVRPADVLGAARRILEPDGLVLLAVGDESGFGPEIAP